MRLFKAIIVLISVLFATVACAGTTGAKTPGDTKGYIGEMPDPIWLGNDVKYSMPAFLFRRTQFLRFNLNKEEKKMKVLDMFTLNIVYGGRGAGKEQPSEVKY